MSKKDMEDIEAIQAVVNKYATSSQMADAWLAALVRAEESGLISKDVKNAITISSAIILNEILFVDNDEISRRCSEELNKIAMNKAGLARAVRDMDEAEASGVLDKLGVYRVPEVKH